MPVTSSRLAISGNLQDQVRVIAVALGCNICLYDDPETAILYLRADPPPARYFADVPPLGGFAASFPIVDASACDEYWSILAKPFNGEFFWTNANLLVLESRSGVRMNVGRGPDERPVLLIHPPIEGDFDAAAFFKPLWPSLTAPPPGCEGLFNGGLGPGTPIAAEQSVSDWAAALPNHPYWTVDVVSSDPAPLRCLIDQFALGSPGTMTLVSNASIPENIRKDLQRRFGRPDAYRIPLGYAVGFDPWSSPDFVHETSDNLRFPVYRRAEGPSEPTIQIDVVHREGRPPLLDIMIHHDDDAAAVAREFEEIRKHLPDATHESNATWNRTDLP